ncbi:MAG: hypothetical protein Q9165_005898 [Trypethelium subeluteriae]
MANQGVITAIAVNANGELSLTSNDSTYFKTVVQADRDIYITLINCAVVTINGQEILLDLVSRVEAKGYRIHLQAAPGPPPRGLACQANQGIEASLEIGDGKEEEDSLRHSSHIHSDDITHKRHCSTKERGTLNDINLIATGSRTDPVTRMHGYDQAESGNDEPRWALFQWCDWKRMVLVATISLCILTVIATVLLTIWPYKPQRRWEILWRAACEVDSSTKKVYDWARESLSRWIP